MKKKKPTEIKDILQQQKLDRRSLPNVPDPDKLRSGGERRGNAKYEQILRDYDAFMESERRGIRYIVDIPASIHKKGVHVHGSIKDISSTGCLMRLDKASEYSLIEGDEKNEIIFTIQPGMMPEGYEMDVKTRFRTVREFEMGEGESREVFLGIQFEKNLIQYAYETKNRVSLVISSIILFFITLVIILMRAESVIYFKFNKWLYLYSILAAVFLLSRYLLGAFYRHVPVDYNYTPGVTIIIPCYNEETWIDRTIIQAANQDYPIDKLEVLIVDDCSTDNSREVILKTIKKLDEENQRFRVKERVRAIFQEKNGGKREALSAGVRVAKHELVVFVDSDSFLDVFAIRNIVQPFKDPKTGGVSGRCDVANTYTNELTRMQSVRYYIAFRIMKAAESVFDTVTCLSGPLSCYRKEIVESHIDDWLNQKFLGQKATFGDDRSMTNYVLRDHRCNYQDTAIVHTIVPNNYPSFLKQQMRWKRSWLRESMIAGTFMWKKEPFAALFFYIGLVVPIAAPIVVLYNLVYIPIVHRVFPTTFLVGLLMMSLLMSFVQLILRKSSTWLYAIFFCIYYEAVLLWQMPIAMLTFWKSTWGTRMTPEDIKEKEEIEKRWRAREERNKMEKKAKENV